MVLPTVAVGSLGGTITMTSAGTAGVTPALDADDLIATVPGIAEVAHLTTATLATVPGASLRFEDVLAALRWAAGEVERGATGVVLVQGTDTLEESAYLLDLFWDRPEPLLLTGAMRSPQTPGADGPANLLAAILTARTDASRSRGVLVVMNDEIHAARHVSKIASTGTDAFRSPNTGPAGYVRESRVAYGGCGHRLPPLERPDLTHLPRVALLEACLGDDDGLLRLAAYAGYDGIVIGGFGAGHLSSRWADAVGDLTDSIPVVFASRTGAGTTLTRTYAFDGSESDLIARGAVPAGWLPPRKARILLWALLTRSTGRTNIEAEFARRGAW